MKHTLTPVERAEYEVLVAEVLAENESTSDRTDAMLVKLHDAVQAGRTWATRVLDDYTRDGAAKDVRAAAKAGQTSTLRTRKGGTRSVPVVVGVQRNGEWTQARLPDLTLSELVAHADMIRAQVAGLGSHEVAVRRLIVLYVRHPHAVTLDAALTAEGLTLDDVLGRAA